MSKVSDSTSQYRKPDTIPTTQPTATCESRTVPELPEVEAIRHYLTSRNVIGTQIQNITTDARIVQPSTDAPSIHQLLGSTITRIQRRGKYLIMGLQTPDAHETRLILHMMMTGSIRLQTADQPSDLAYVRATIELQDGNRILLNDPRRWAKIWIVDYDHNAPTDNLGPELSDITPADFANRVRRRRQLIKPALLNQHLVAGIGNIYADESLHAARICPTRRASDITPGQLHDLHSAINNVFRHATLYIIDHPATDGSPYVVDAHDARMMLPRGKHSTCPTCQTTLTRTKIAGRTTIHCQTCQQ